MIFNMKNKHMRTYIISILIYFSFMFLIDRSGITNLYGQNIIRRWINMYRRIDPINYKMKLSPFCTKYDRMLNSHDISRLQSIRIPERNDISIFTRKNTTTHQCCDGYSDDEKKIIDEISEKIRLKYQKKLGKKLFYLESNKATIYRYHGNKSKHLWHVDPQNLSSIYNVIVCIKKKGGISPLDCKDEIGDKHSVHFDEGTAALFNGGTTVHQVPPNDDPDSERTVLSIAYTSDKILSKNKNNSNNLCTHIEGGNNYANLFKSFLTIFLINFMISKISGINKINNKSIILLMTTLVVMSRYQPYSMDVGLGTGRASSIHHNIILWMAFLLSTVSIKGGTIFFSYFLLSDLFFPRKWVEYD